jgi:hypothetical protein
MSDSNWGRWRTSAVVAICRRIRETGDYSALPILADALQDAGCEEDEVLGPLRSELKLTAAQRLVCLVHGGEPAAAVQWLEDIATKFLRDFPNEELCSYEELMEAADKCVATGQERCLPSADYSIAYDEVLAKRFWDHYETVTGTTVDGTQRFVFRCCW